MAETITINLTDAGETITATINEAARGATGPSGASTWDDITGTATAIPFAPTTAPAHAEGNVYYNEADHSLAYQTDEPDVEMNIGREMWVRVRNNSGATITNGKVVYLSGATGQLPTIALARADSATTSRVIGVATHDIENNSNGYVTSMGEVKGLNTSAFSDGAILYLSAATAGELTATAPSAPNRIIQVATVEHSHVSQGKLFVHPETDSVASTGIVDSTATGRSILTAADPAAVRAAAKIDQGPFAGPIEATQAGVIIGQSYRKTGGTMAWVDADSVALAYQAAHGISDLAAVRMSEFLTGLTEIGLRDNLVDAAVYRADSQPASGSIAPSILGLSNLTLYGSPERARGAIICDEGTNYMMGSTPSISGARTVVPVYASNRYTNSTAFLNFRLQTGTSGTANPSIMLYTTAGTSGLNAIFHNGSAAREIVAGGSRASALLQIGLLRDLQLGNGVAGSFLAKTRLNSTGAFSSENAGAGLSNYTTTHLRIGGQTSPMSGWAIFNEAISDSAANDLVTLFADTIFPRFVMVIEGDSISDDLAIGIANEGNFRGQNMILREVADGGQTAADGVAALGSGTGLTDANLSGAGYPVICHIAFGANDLGNFSAAAMPVSTIHANLRTLWAYAKTRGATVAASTVMASGGIAGQGRESDRLALNALIVADAGTYYDVLVDRDAWANAATIARPYYTDTNLFRDNVHLNMSVNMGNALLCRYTGTALADYIP